MSFFKKHRDSKDSVDEDIVIDGALGGQDSTAIAAPNNGAQNHEALLELINDKAKLRNWIALKLMEESTLCPTTAGRLKALSQLSELCLVDERTKYRVENKSDTDFNIIVVSERLEQARQLKMASVNRLSSIQPAQLPTESQDASSV